MIINILCPTRGRPEQYDRMFNSALSMADDKSKIAVFGLRYKDDESKYSPFLTSMNEVCGRGGGSYWNILVDKAINLNPNQGHLFMLIGDDCVFETQGWDTRIRLEAEKYPDGIFCIAPNDARGNGSPHFVVSQKWVDALGYFVNPSFRHFCVDTYTEYLARAVKRFIYLEDVIVKHKKGSEQHYDETADRIRRTNLSLLDIKVMNILINDGYADAEIELLKAAMQ